MQLTTPLAEVLRTTPEYIRALADLRIYSVGDLLLYLPRAHEDLSQMQTLASAPLETKVTIRGSIDHLKMSRIRGGKYLVKGTFTDTEGGIAAVVWFNQPHIMRMLKDGEIVVLTGKIAPQGHRLQFSSPSFESANRPLVHSGRLVPLYPQHERVSSKWLREKMLLVKSAIRLLPETLPLDIIAEEHLIGRQDTVHALHFPESSEDIRRAFERIAFEEMFRMQADIVRRKQEWQGKRQERLRIPMDVELIRTFFRSLGFTPTDSQRIAIYEILKDMERDIPMSRLLEGDVGSGKTLVAIAVISTVLKAGRQCALMVPTEVLAKQHAETIARTLLKFHAFARSEGMQVPPPSVALLTGSLTASEVVRVRSGLASGFIGLVIGTHALITESVRFSDLGLVIVDEQHRFGVEQRERLKEKGNPHFLAMTATPIPRTLALTAYGQNDLSVLLEKPGKKSPIATRVVPPSDRLTVEHFIDVEIARGCQAFVICPLITQSVNEEMAEIRSVEAEVKRLKAEFPHRRVAFLHGKMTPSEKDAAMRRFKNREEDILVSTAVIEVGIDIPNASIIVIEGAERFGLAQLHQFRGRVGRGERKSHCFLFTTTVQQANSVRLKAMEKYDSGFALAEIDLQIRGPGELFGLRQSGIPDISVRQMFSPELVVRARRAAEKAMHSA
ncbi:MAG: ATP-dependent DNA helicase RecG [Candidatus Peregrinibacteria bacterium]